jgi:O-succinylbenzoic acid--CoA ligase
VSPGYAGNHRLDPWFTTSDRGTVWEDGSIEVFGRVDRVINSGGEKIDATAVEAALAAAGAGEVAVAGLADSEWGEIVVAVYTGDVGVAELRQAVRDSLGPEAVPRRLLRLEALPRTDLGKIDYFEMVRIFAT